MPDRPQGIICDFPLAALRRECLTARLHDLVVLAAAACFR